MRTICATSIRRFSSEFAGSICRRIRADSTHSCILVARSASKEAFQLTDRIRRGLNAELGDITGTDVLVTGSIARQEVTRDSDCDYLIVSTTIPDHDLIINIFRAVNKIMKELELQEPGSQGVFGDFVAGAELFFKIGLDRDSNINTTRRFSVLLESCSVLSADVRARVIQKIIERYCAQYHPKHRKADDTILVPRFLVNDLIRYWRTIAVDFEAKRWRDLNEAWGLRYIKLLTLRKMMFASSLAAFLLVGKKIESIVDPEERYNRLIAELCSLSELPPLARLASAHDVIAEPSKELVLALIKDYNEIIDLLGQRGARAMLKSLSPEDQTTKRFQELSGQIQARLEQLFFDDDLLKPLTRRYSLF